MIDTLDRKIDDLENRSKRNNVVIWGLKEAQPESIKFLSLNVRGLSNFHKRRAIFS